MQRDRYSFGHSVSQHLSLPVCCLLLALLLGSCCGGQTAVLQPDAQDGTWTVGAERQLGGYTTLLPAGKTTWPNGIDLPPEVIEITSKLEQGESLTNDEEITLLAIDQNLRNWDELVKLGQH